ncbi:TPA: hypothetical protein KRM61_000863 [Clostridioides difficile]|nr:hypothetical protein [Clostridioides difficile]HBF8167673.1 hypothetical protein [Clostridioides difficile]HBH1807237.1 hypothetical protein [Clostridioides difficile]
MNELQEKEILLIEALNDMGFQDTFKCIEKEDTVLFTAVQDLHQSQCTIILEIDNSIFSSMTIFFATLENLSKKEKILELVNDLNIRYRNSKYFISHNNEIGVQVTYTARANNFEVNDFFTMFHIMLRTLQDNDYSKFMRVIWS